MSVAFYFDEHVHSGITRALRQRGVKIITVQEDGRAGADDSDLVDRAMGLGMLVFTQDDDFLAEATRRQRGGEHFSGVIYAHQQNASIRQCIDDLELIAGASELSEYVNRVVFLPLRI